MTPNVNKRQNEPVKTQSLFAKLMRMDGMNAVVAKAAEIHPVRAEMSCQLVSIFGQEGVAVVVSMLRSQRRVTPQEEN